MSDQIDIAAIEAQGAEPLPIEEAGAGFVAYVRPFSYSEFRDFTNAGARPGDEGANARTMAMHRAVVWPSRAEVARAYRDFPATRGRVLDALERFAGKLPEQWVTLDRSVDTDQLAELGIPCETAADLLAKFPLLGQLRICQIKDLDLVIVVRRPTAPILERLFERSKEAYFDAALEASLDCVVWIRDRETVGAGDLAVSVFRDLPALSGNTICPELTRMIKGGSSSEKKGFMPKGRKRAVT